MTPVRAAVKAMLERANLSLTRNDTYQRLLQHEQLYFRGRQFLRFLPALKPAYVPIAVQRLEYSQSQFFQDIVASLLTPGAGYFVEFGATDGVTISNSWLLEKQLGWQGILAEPVRRWRAALHRNRTVYISTDCVWSESGAALEFCETEDPSMSGITGTYDGRQRQPQSRQSLYNVRTISLHDLLLQAAAPRIVDFLSIDTEGSEHAILSAFPFDNWTIRYISVEHNHRPDRADLERLLGTHGYRPFLREYSAVDDWYIHPSAHAQAAEVFHLD